MNLKPVDYLFYRKLSGLAALILAALVLAGCNAWPQPGSLLVTPSPIPAEPPAATVTASPTSPQAAQIEKRLFCTVATGENGGTLHIRTGAGVEYQVVGYAAEGDTLTVLETAGNGWRKVNTPAGLTGWVNSVYCK